MAGDDSGPLINEKKGNKPRMGVILRQTLGEKSANGNEDLQALKLRYQTMCKRMQTVQKALKDRHAAMLATTQARVAVAQTLSAMSHETPLEKIAGSPSDDKKSSAGNETYGSIMIDDMDRETRKHADDFHKFAIDYVAEWEKIVTTRINADLKTTEQLRRDADHYKSKVESLQGNVKKFQDHNKDVPQATKDKLNRNEKKLADANRLYSDAAEDLYLLMEELVDRSWRDLHPLLMKTLQMEVDICQHEQQVMAAPFARLMENMSALAEQEQVKPRLKDVVDGTPEMLSTRPNGVDSNFALNFGGDDVPEQAPATKRGGFTRQVSGGDSD
ncbi:hypothetical protein ACA910_016174 [Epithemia clementina (nom. ined.)]